MAYMFNFDLQDEDCDSGSSLSLHTMNEPTFTNRSHVEDKHSEDSSHVKLLPALEITEFYCDGIISKLEMKTVLFGDISLKVVDTSTMEQKLLDDNEIASVLKSSSQLSDAVNSHSDLVAGVYEGGLKIWECAMDLVDFLSSHPVGAEVDLKGKKVLELGCGSGLPGLYCCRCGAKQVDFQDYNEEVLKLLTHTNVMKNQKITDGLSFSCRYFAGDWSSFSRLAIEKGLKYDIILTAETIYSTDNYSKLHDVFNAALADDGIIFLAAKTYYFGVGGGVDAFIEYVRRENCFSVDIVHSFNKGVQRKILKLGRHHSEKTNIDN